MDELPAIPLIDVGAGGPIELARRERARARALLAASRRRHGRTALYLGDRISTAWLRRAQTPFAREVQAIAEVVGGPGVVMVNSSFEWTCTSATAPDPAGPGNRLLRVLDWPLDGLGRNVVVAREAAPAGVFYNVTWPGAVGVFTALAPGRFAAAINQAPMRRHGLTLAGDWVRNRLAVWRSRAIPPAHLLRRAFASARDYDEARAMLAETPLALPCLFVLSGVRPEEGCVIERTEDRAYIHPSPATCANAWLTHGLGGRPRGRDNAARQTRLAAFAREAHNGFAWLVPPILNRRTRVAAAASAASGTLRVLGIERERPATLEFQWVHREESSSRVA